MIWLENNIQFPLKEVIDICADAIYRNDDIEAQLAPLTEESFRRLMELVTSDVEFSFDGTMYRQTDGVAMGSPVGPALANIFVGYYEKKIPDDQWPEMYHRYVDDVFSHFVSKDHSGQFLQRLNSLHLALQFTCEGEERGTLPFLDVKVIRELEGIVTSIYRKPTFTGLYTPWDSYSPTKYKINLVRSLSHRARRICSPAVLANWALFVRFYWGTATLGMSSTGTWRWMLLLVIVTLDQGHVQYSSDCLGSAPKVSSFRKEQMIPFALRTSQLRYVLFTLRLERFRCWKTNCLPHPEVMLSIFTNAGIAKAGMWAKRLNILVRAYVNTSQNIWLRPMWMKGNAVAHRRRRHPLTISRRSELISLRIAVAENSTRTRTFRFSPVHATNTIWMFLKPFIFVC